MNTMHRTIILAALTALAGGCLPEKRICWSPDGSRAAVATPTGLYLIDATGKALSPRLTGTPARCDWFPDGKRLAVVHTARAGKWSDAEPLFDKAGRDRIERHAKDAHERLLAYSGSLDDFKLDPHDELSPGDEGAVLLCLRDRHAEKLKEKLGDKWSDLEKLQATVWKLSVFTVDADAFKEQKALYRGLNEIHAPAVSPNGRNIAFLMNSSKREDNAISLFVVTAEGGEARQVAESVAVGYDWSPDSRSLVFIRGTTDAPPRDGSIDLGSLTTVVVCDEAGALLKEWAQRTDRVGVLFSPMLGARWLRDGRLIFSSVEVTLPATSRDMPQAWTMFVLDPRMPASVTRVLGRDFSEAVEPSLGLFETSPDEAQVLLPGPQGALSLYEFASGQTQSLVDVIDAKGKSLSLPCWRSAQEACFVGRQQGKDGKPSAPEVWLWKAGKATCISADWPKEMREGWLDE